LKIEVIGNWKFRCCKVRGRVIKQGLLSALSAFLLHKTRDTPSRVNREVSISSIWIIGIFIKERVKIVTKKKSGKRFFGLMTGGKKEVHFFGKGYCEKCTGMKQQRKGEWKGLIANWSAGNFCRRKLCWNTPVYHVLD
jgi:hypothetical protein